PLASGPRVVVREVRGRRSRDVSGERILIGLVGKIGRLRLIAPESKLDENGRHVRTAQYGKICLLHSSVWSGVNVDQPRLYRFRQVARFRGMLQLGHVGAAV